MNSEAAYRENPVQWLVKGEGEGMIFVRTFELIKLELYYFEDIVGM